MPRRSEQPSTPEGSRRPLFALGQIVATPGALEALAPVGGLQKALELIQRHVTGDWGALDEHDLAVNRQALASSGRIFSLYLLETGQRMYIITEWDRSYTTLLLPEEY